MLRQLKISHCLIVLFNSAILAFGLYNVHAVANITEGGVLGMMLFLKYWFHISPAISSFVMDSLCYAMGWALIGKQFAFFSLLATFGFSAAYAVFEQFNPIWPQLAEMPLTAAFLGAIFVGVGAGMCVRVGGAAGGDDALAMSISHITHMKIQWSYILTDLIVLRLSLSYIPISRICYSFLTAFLSGQLIGLMQKVPLPGETSEKTA